MHTRDPVFQLHRRTRRKETLPALWSPSSSRAPFTSQGRRPAARSHQRRSPSPCSVKWAVQRVADFLSPCVYRWSQLIDKLIRRGDACRTMPTTDPPSPTDVSIGPGRCCAPTSGHTLLRRFPTFCDNRHAHQAVSYPNLFFFSFSFNAELAATARLPAYSPRLSNTILG
jgi:hypothetical protein